MRSATTPQNWEKAGDAAEAVLGSPLQGLIRAAAFVCTIYVLAVIGFVLSGWSLGDAAYMVMLTIFSVGFNEVHPIDTPGLRGLTMATILLGCTGMIVLTGALVQFLAHLQLRSLLGIDRMTAQIAKLSQHTIICGFGRIGQQLAHELAEAHEGFVVVELDPAKFAIAQAAGYACLTADATDEAALQAAGIARARVLATVLPSDATNVFITLSARNLNPGLQIIARGEIPSTERKLIHAGADKVVLPMHIGAERIAEMILYPSTEHLLETSPTMRDLKRGLHDVGLGLESLTVPQHSALAGSTVAEAERRGNGGFFIVQVERPGEQIFARPGKHFIIEAQDSVILVMRGNNVSAGAIFNAPKQPLKIGRGFTKMSDG
ncbi:MAG: NAD-binding protein [Pseudomonadota bacterium]|nr:NAD-binding protein [Pseudomonadota bacterium]